jgi:predicted DNA-binding transcriptional regulator AlpA
VEDGLLTDRPLSKTRSYARARERLFDTSLSSSAKRKEKAGMSASEEIREEHQRVARRAITRADLPAMGIKYSDPHLRKLIRLGLFPRPFWLSPRRPCWWWDDIQNWLEERSRASA